MQNRLRSTRSLSRERVDLKRAKSILKKEIDGFLSLKEVKRVSIVIDVDSY